jgi:2-methylcitrate dehydratase PrpD
LNAEEQSRAFGLVGSQAAGSMQFLADGAWNKPFHTGYAAMNGLIAATMAREGFFGTAQALEGQKGGFLKAYAPNPDPTAVVARLGERYETMEIAVKPYPSCRYGHAAIDALIALRAANDIDFRDVDSVEVGLPRTGWNLIGDPETTKQNPKNYVDGQFSMSFVAAVALREGRMGWDDYANHLGNDETLALCRRVRANVDDRCEAVFPNNMSGVVRVALAGGSSFEEMVVTPKGEPDNFLSTDEMLGKFNTLVAPYLAESQRTLLSDTLLTLNGKTDTKGLLGLTRPLSGDGFKVAQVAG